MEGSSHQIYPRSQRHHFIPRFILRNFRADNQPPAGPSRSSKCQKKNKPSSQKRDFLVNKIDLLTKEITQRPISQENSVANLYKDHAYSGNPYHLEEKFAILEQQAAKILKEACEVFDRKETLVLSRQRKDVLRKFLFLMKYRNLVFYKRYDHETIDEYDGYDKDSLKTYMERKGFKSPREVWFDNIRVFLDVELDVENNWVHQISHEAYREDAELFRIHVRNQFITFCRPRTPQDEFILTENAYGVFEGPTSFSGNPMGPGIATEYHNFAPISPQLIIILRSCLLVSPAEEGAPELVGDHELWNRMHRSMHAFPEEAYSILQDLPVKRYGMSCSRDKAGHIRASRELSSQDKFIFHCFELSSKHVHLINEIFLEESSKVSSIIYRSGNALRKSIEAYLEDDERVRFKVIKGPKDPHLVYLVTLLRILKELGGSVQGLHLNLDRNPYSIYATTATTTSSLTACNDHTSTATIRARAPTSTNKIQSKAEGQEAETHSNGNADSRTSNIMIECYCRRKVGTTLPKITTLGEMGLEYYRESFS